MASSFLFDLDGTLFDASHRMHHIQKDPPDWDKFFADVGGDKPIHHMVIVACALHAYGVAVIYVTGRSEVCRNETLDSFKRAGLPPGLLFMRKIGDHRDDDVVKLELLDEIRALGYRPVLAFEDRSRVVAAWRNAGIPCAQVAPGDF